MEGALTSPLGCRLWTAINCPLPPSTVFNWLLLSSTDINVLLFSLLYSYVPNCLQLSSTTIFFPLMSYIFFHFPLPSSFFHLLSSIFFYFHLHSSNFFTFLCYSVLSYPVLICPWMSLILIDCPNVSLRTVFYFLLGPAMPSPGFAPPLLSPGSAPPLLSPFPASGRFAL